MKKLTVLLIAFFISFSSAHAEIDIAAALQSGQTEQEVLAQLTESGMDITDAVEAMIEASPENAASITAAAIASAPEQANAITQAALMAAPEQAAAINQASQSASDPTANLGATASGPTPGVTAPAFSTPTSTPSGGGGGTAASPA
ncbi:MAG: hypothetical protein JKY53_13015 [Flavobacteriales bacterium]|nr:hypothetical protein [Flavobacteriales bacterium]